MDRVMEFKAVPMTDLQIEDDRLVKSIFSVMGNIDLGGDRILSGAFNKTIGDRLRSGNIKVLWQHNQDEPAIGVPEALKEIKRDALPESLRAAYPDATGALYGEVRFLDTPRGNEVLAGIKAGAITQNSIGYDAVDKSFEDHPDYGQVRNLKAIRLWDISPVNFGMNPATMNLKRMTPEEVRVSTILGLVDELKAGRVLSAANLTKLKQAIEALSEVLVAAEPPKSAPDTALTVLALMQRMAIAEREAMFVS